MTDRRPTLSAEVLTKIGERLFRLMCEAGPAPLETEMLEVIDLVLDGYDRTLEDSPDWRWLSPTHSEIIDL